MSTFLYTRPSDRKTGTLTVNTGVEDAAYPKENLDDGHPEKPAKLTGTSGSWVRDMGGATRIDLCAVIHHNFDEALDVKLQGHTSNAWGAPTLSTDFTIPARHADSFPVNVWLDLATLFPTAGDRTFQWWRLLINAANSVAVSVGEWAMYGTKRDLGVRNIKWGSERRWRRPAIVQETDLLVRRTYDLGTTVRAVDVEIDPTDAILAEVDAWFRDAQGPTRPFTIVPHQDENDAWFVTFTNQDQAYRRQRRNYNPGSLTFQELSRGLFP